MIFELQLSNSVDNHPTPTLPQKISRRSCANPMTFPSLNRKGCPTPVSPAHGCANFNRKQEIHTQIRFAAFLQTKIQDKNEIRRKIVVSWTRNNAAKIILCAAALNEVVGHLANERRITHTRDGYILRIYFFRALRSRLNRSSVGRKRRGG